VREQASNEAATEPTRLRIARIYFHRRTETRRPGVLGWLFPAQTGRVLAERALKAGAIHASLTLGHLGFVKGAKRVEQEQVETSSASLPSCLEVVAPPAILDRFLTDNARDLAHVTVVLLDGVEVRPAADRSS
jgi:PII-like signaling protein